MRHRSSLPLVWALSDPAVIRTTAASRENNRCFFITPPHCIKRCIEDVLPLAECVRRLETAGVGFLPSHTQLLCTRNTKLPSDSVRSFLRLKALIRLFAALEDMQRLGRGKSKMYVVGLSDQIGLHKRDRLWLTEDSLKFRVSPEQ
jgi:hypothetical protein